MKDKVIEILECFKSDEITIENAQEKIFDFFKINKDTLSIPDIRNKLSPLTHLITVIEDERIKEKDWLPEALKGAKRSVNYLAQRDVYPKKEK